MDENLLDDIIRRLLDAKNGRTPKQVHLADSEIRQLCATSREIFLSQPNLLELEAPFKICGKKKRMTNFNNIMFCLGYITFTSFGST